MAETVLGGIKRASGWSIVLGVLIVLVGIIALMAPLATGVVAVYILAWSVIFAGVAQIAYAFQAHSGGRIALEVILGLVYIAAGIYILRNPLASLLTLTLLLGILLLGYAVVALILAFQMRPSKGWGWVLFEAVVTAIFGLMVIAHWPINSVFLIGTLVGVSIVFRGVSRIMVSQQIRSTASALA
jgi:uncharacterized membrane protein HdeD (DUF308 family)